MASNAQFVLRRGLKKDILDGLDSIDNPGTFASSRPIAKLPSMRLVVDGIGEIKTPLGEEQAREMIAKSRQAPYGKGSETIVDTSVRNTWEMDASEFSFQDPKWSEFVESLCRTVAEDLGIHTPIRAELYKMLIYEKGAMFKAHTDTEKIPGMFGTLVICLPSAHEGGDVVAKHLGETKTFKTSIHQQSTVCWYSDVSHEVLPVTSGYRWVLTYNLAIDHDHERPSAGVQLQAVQPLRQHLNRWLNTRQESGMKYIYHLLDHIYTEAQLSLNALKGEDLARTVMGPCEPNSDDERYDRWGNRYTGFESESEGDEEEAKRFHYIDFIFDSSLQVRRLVDLQGRHVLDSRLPLETNDLLDEQGFDGMDPDEESYQGFMGNSGPDATHFYRTAALVLVPRDSLSEYFSSCSYSSGVISYFTRFCEERSDYAEAAFDTVQKLCGSVWNDQPKTYDLGSYGAASKPQISGDTYQEILKAAINLGRFSFFEEGAGKHDGCLPPEFFPWLRRWLCDGDVDERFRLIEKGLNLAVQPYKFLAHRARVVIALLGEPPVAPNTPDILVQWGRATLRELVESLKSWTATGILSLGGKDGSLLVVLSRYFEDPMHFIKDSVVPILDAKRHPASFTLDFMARLKSDATKGLLPAEEVNQLYYTLAKSFIERAPIGTARSKEGVVLAETKRPRYFGYTPTTYDDKTHTDAQIRTALNPESLITFFSSLLPHQELLTSLVTKLITSANKIPHFADFHHLWLPFLRILIPILQTNKIPLTTLPYQTLYHTFLLEYLKTYVQKNPTTSTSLVRPTVSCPCGDCWSLNRFLSSPEQRVGRFSMGKGRRQHLHQQLDGAMIDCRHITERSGNPQTLVVTKTFTRAKQRLDAWKSRREMALKEMAKFPREELMLLLEDVGEVVVLHAGSTAPVAGVKRKIAGANVEGVEFIDLTDDE
ncbi:hypothetical protein QBC42DRAFT_337508 [Cladorrhinum samala]|uniref:Prolyl 4-hydroxylase alpha subunit Fe(2+) 2OG dioxygenase domain-containing protein n=1 Tax=Cladorrhinum samala TaxID=585594 RepID=A0AAV9HRN0_9PEZI|nr:hypothetical protein QBC42DRAFT_337508 [Cladorrhinum samala]